MSTEAASRRFYTPRPPFSETHDLRPGRDAESRPSFGAAEIAAPVSSRPSEQTYGAGSLSPSTPTVRIYPVDEYAD